MNLINRSVYKADEIIFYAFLVLLPPSFARENWEAFYRKKYLSQKYLSRLLYVVTDSIMIPIFCLGVLHDIDVVDIMELCQKGFCWIIC